MHTLYIKTRMLSAIIGILPINALFSTQYDVSSDEQRDEIDHLTYKSRQSNS